MDNTFVIVVDYYKDWAIYPRGVVDIFPNKVINQIIEEVFFKLISNDFVDLMNSSKPRVGHRIILVNY